MILTGGSIDTFLQVDRGYTETQRSGMNFRKTFDSGLAIIIFIIVSLFVILFYLLLFVKYEWCPVLFKNNTVSIRPKSHN